MVNWFSPSCRFVFVFFCFLLEGGSCFCFAGKSSWVDIVDGLSEGRDGVPVRFRVLDRSADCDLGRGI